MGFLTPALLAGAAFMAVPIVLHLVMRRQPRKLPFPALQFVRKRQQANRRKLNLRHWLLLALRCLLIAGFAFALARPTLKGSGLRGKEGAPLAISLVLDNSLRMQYLHDNQTRQQQAAKMAQGLLDKLPEGTEVAIIDRSRATSGFVADVSIAQSRLRNLQPESKPRPIADAVSEAIELVADRPDSQQEIFLFSDLSANNYDEATLTAMNEALAAAPDVRLYLVDVGVAEPRNLSLGPLQLRRQVLRLGEPLRLEASLTAQGVSEAPLVELHLQQPSTSSGPPTTIKRGQQLVEVTDGQGSVTFELGDLPLGTHQGYLQIPTTDPLTVDNTQYFTVEVRSPTEVLLLGQQPTDTLFLQEALDPSTNINQTPAQFECSVNKISNATKLTLNDYAAVCLLDPPALADELWQTLTDYADNGGGLALFLGQRANASSFNEGLANVLLPGKLRRKSRYETYLRPRSFNHPALTTLSPYSESIPWQAYPVFRYWEFDQLASDAYTIAPFANNKPALLLRSVGQGRVLTFATSISDPPNLRGREPWNLLTAPEAAWPFVPLMNQLVGYLSQTGNQSLSFPAGETVSLYLPPSQRVSSFVLYPPDGQPLRRTLPPGDDTIRISTTRDLGNYRVSSGGDRGQLKRGFSVNVSPETSQLNRIDPEQLLTSLPDKQVRLAGTLTDIEHHVNIGRTGQELFPYFITLVALLWGTEHLLANRFYRETPE